MIRTVDICVISDVHLGTYGCHADELMTYLKSIKPKVLVINGDFIDAWQFKKKFFPKAHLELIRHVIDMAISGVKVYYITGNHDDVLRRFADMSIGLIHLKDSLSLQLNGEKYWFFHGDIFDASVMISPQLAALGGKGYDYLIRLNRLINRMRERMGKPRISISKRVKSQVKRAVKYISDFETLAVRHGARMNCDYVVCGHIHRPTIERRTIKGHTLTYMNSGDWVENLSALELVNGEWRMFMYEESNLHMTPVIRHLDVKKDDSNEPARLKQKVLSTKQMLKLW